MPKRTTSMAAVLPLLLLLTTPASAQSLDVYKQRGRIMLDQIRKDIEKNYYDPTFHGLDLQASFARAQEKVKGAESLGQIFGIIGQTLIELDDSHTFFVPPERTERVEYGWEMGMVGDRCLVTAIKPGSDAAAKGLRVGDEVLAIDGRVPRREHLWILHYLYHALRPQPGMNVTVKRGDGNDVLAVAAEIHQGKRVLDMTTDEVWAEIREGQSQARLHRHRYHEDLDGVFIWKMPRFNMEAAEIDRLVGRFRDRQTLILDLRGNHGGREDTMLRLIGNLFDRDVTVGKIQRRTETRPVVAKTRGEHAYKGRVIVLIDHASASAAEVLARVVQLEKRGVVIGDRSAGAVMRSRFYDYKGGADTVYFYGASITDADVILSDGKSLERTGVTPDELLLPAPEDLAQQRDPVLARAAALAGAQLTAEKAGALFPVEWRK